MEPKVTSEPEVQVNKECMELVKIVLEQNHIILLTNKMLMEHLATPVMYVKPIDK